MKPTPYLLPILVAVARLSGANYVSDALKATPTACIADGNIIGTTTSVSGPTGSVAVNKFLGIPYAAPPTGEARFSPPHAPKPWHSLNTTQFGPSCIQVFSPLSRRPFIEAVFNNPAPASESEDCLYINVFAPKKAWDPANPPFPVLYWMYGGGWRFGNAAQPTYDGAHFAGLEDVIVVSVNYRTNVFGLPAFPGITNLTNRNLALLDQRAGISWTQRNIHAFGGNSSSITIFGESAGAFAVDILRTSYPPNTTYPFHAAIMQSGVYAYLALPNCDNTNFNAWGNLTHDLNCTGSEEQKFDCVRRERTAKQIKHVQEANANASFSHTCDNITIVSDPRSRLEARNVASVPVLLGTNTAEGSYYVLPFQGDVDVYFTSNFGPWQALKDAVLAAYPLGSGGRTNDTLRLQQIDADWKFHCPAVWNANTSSSNPLTPTHRYLYNATFPNTRAPIPPNLPSNFSTWWPPEAQGAYHSSEIPLVFTSYNASTETPEQRQLSETMRHAWAEFARDPQKETLMDGKWVRVGKGGEGNEKDVMVFGVDGKAGSEMARDEDNCAVWELFGFRMWHL